MTNEVIHPSDCVCVDTGKGQVVEALIGSPFAATVKRIAKQALYAHLFRVFLNGEEIASPSESPELIQPNMEIAIRSYAYYRLLFLEGGGQPKK